MTSINGNFGLFGNNGDKRIGQQKGTQKPAEVKPDVPVGKTENVEYKESGDKLLESANFYAGMGISLGATKKPEAGSLEDLTQVVQNLNASKADRADKKAAFNAIEGNDWSTWLIKANVYSKLDEASLTGLNGSAVQMQKLNELQGLT